jgi:hypothetical protein
MVAFGPTGPEGENPENLEEREPTSQELAEVCAEVLDEETCAEIAAMSDLEEAISYAFAVLIEAGVDDPEQFLIEKGILQQQ